MEQSLNNKIKAWLDSPKDKRDVLEGAKLLLQVTRNHIIYDNARRFPAKYADRVEYELNKVYKSRLIKVTKAEVAALMAEVDVINQSRGLDKPIDTKRSDFQRGKRADHDSLPREVQKLWEDNADIMKNMRDCHAHLRIINHQNSTCPDNDRYPWAKEIIKLDKLYRSNWNIYDHYKPGTKLSDTVAAVDPRTASKNAVKSINLALGRYAKNPTPELADRIKGLYAKIISPDEKITGKMKAAELL